MLVVQLLSLPRLVPWAQELGASQHVSVEHPEMSDEELGPGEGSGSARWFQTRALGAAWPWAPLTRLLLLKTKTKTKNKKPTKKTPCNSMAWAYPALTGDPAPPPQRAERVHGP